MGSNEPNRTERAEVNAYERFMEKQRGVYPATYAARILKISVQALHMAAKSGRIESFKIGKKRLYGYMSVKEYRWYRSRKFRDNGNQRPNS